jgi:hypothetical protein
MSFKKVLSLIFKSPILKIVSEILVIGKSLTISSLTSSFEIEGPFEKGGVDLC